MQADDHVDIKLGLIAMDVADFKVQMIIAVSPGDLVAVSDHVRLQIQADGIYFYFSDPGQVII